MYRPFRAAVKRHHFVRPGDVVLAGVSGGLDSMVLARLLSDLKTDISFGLCLAHVNYKMRGRESDAQEKLVRDFAKQHSLNCFASRADLQREGENFQQEAREFRYHFFAETAGRIGAGKIAVAHTQDDQVETILAQLLRGASLRGLGGMAAEREIRNLKLIRPLLDFSKDQLRQYARAHRVPFIEDSSNASPEYWRNRIRHELLPVLQELRPGAFEKIVRFGEEARELAEFLEGLAKDWLQEYGKIRDREVWLPRPRWLALPKPLRLEILAQAYARLKGDSRQLRHDHLWRCDQLAGNSKGEGSYPFPGGLKFFRRGDDLLLKRVP